MWKGDAPDEIEIIHEDKVSEHVYLATHLYILKHYSGLIRHRFGSHPYEGRMDYGRDYCSLQEIVDNNWIEEKSLEVMYNNLLDIVDKYS